MNTAALIERTLHSPEVLGSILLLLAAYAIRLFLPARIKKLDDSPLIGKPGDSNFKDALEEGYKKVRTGAKSYRRQCKRLMGPGV